MTNEEFQRLILEKLGKLEATMATKEDIIRLESKIEALDAKVEKYGYVQQEDVGGLIKLMDTKIDKILTTQVIQGESINLLALQQLHTAAEVEVLKKAK